MRRQASFHHAFSLKLAIMVGISLTRSARTLRRAERSINETNSNDESLEIYIENAAISLDSHDGLGDKNLTANDMTEHITGRQSLQGM